MKTLQFLTLTAALALGGCATDGLTPDQRLANRAVNTCATYGIHRDSPQFMQCLQLVEAQRQANLRSSDALLLQGLQGMRGPERYNVNVRYW